MLIDHVEQVPAAERDARNPLYYGEMLVYPNLGDPLRKSTAKALGFFFTARGPATARKGLLEVTKDGSVNGAPVARPARARANGLVQHAGTLALASFAPGAYELKLTMLDGTRPIASRATPLTIAE